MKAAIKHNLFLLKKIHLTLIGIFFFIIAITINKGAGFFIMTIPVITATSIAAMENFDGEKYNILLSLPTTRIEYAKAKFRSLLIVNGVALIFILFLYFISVSIDITKLNLLAFILELSITLPLSISVGGILVGLKTDYINAIISIYILTMYLIVLNVLNMDVELQLGKDIILDAMVLIILSGLNIAAFVGTKRSIINRYNDMEL